MNTAPAPLARTHLFFSFMVMTTLTLLMLLPVFSAQAQEDKRVLAIEEVTSPGGISAWLVRDPTLPVIALQFAFADAGAAHDSEDKQGLSNLLASVMDEGAGSYDSLSFQQTLTDNNISLGFYATRDAFGGSLKVLGRHKDLGFELLRLALNEPRFDDEPLARMRDASISRILSSLSDPEWKAARIMNDIAYQGHPYALNTGGTLTTLKAITADELRMALRGRLGRAALKVGVMGDITAAELAQRLDALFGTLPAKTTLPAIADTQIQGAGSIVLYEHDIPQTIVEIMQPGIGRTDPDYYTGMVMNYILGGGGFGSRLTEEIREKRGLTYGIGSYISDMTHAKGLAISSSTKNEAASELIGLVKAELQKMKDAPVSEDELSAAKSYLIGSFPLGLSSTHAIAGLLLDLQLDDLPADYLDRRAARIDAVTASDIQALAQRLLTPDALTVVLVGNPQGIEPTRKLDILPNVD